MQVAGDRRFPGALYHRPILLGAPFNRGDGAFARSHPLIRALPDVILIGTIKLPPAPDSADLIRIIIPLCGRQTPAARPVSQVCFQSYFSNLP
jgi:hypothetical protein